VRAIVLLAQSGHLDKGGIVSALGLGWNATETPTAQHVLIVFAEVEWSEIGREFPIQAELIDSDGVRVTQTEKSIINAQRSPVHPEGTPVTIPFIATIPPLDLTAGERYQWRVSIGGEMHEDWLAGFTVSGTR
jgi:hypothetical protein